MALKAAFEWRIPELCFGFRLSGIGIRGGLEQQWYASKCCAFATNMWAHVIYSHTSTQYRQVSLDCKMWLTNMQCWISHKDMPRIFWCTRTSTIGQQMLQLCHESPDTGTQYRLVYFHWQMRLPNKQCLISRQDMPWILRCTGES
jgi:hypothetical protein